MDYQYNQYQNTTNKFASAALILGIFSLVMLCTGILAIPFGALGILMGVISKRGKQLHRNAIAGVIISSIGLFSGLLITISVYTTIILTGVGAIEKSQTPEYAGTSAFDIFMEDIYGPSYESIFEKSSGIDYDSYKNMLEQLIESY